MKLKNLLNIRRQLNKPEYYFRPSQLVKRMKYTNKNRSHVAVQVDGSGEDFFVNENEVIGQAILTMGVYDLIVAEAIHRIIEPGDTFLDVGANIGYFSRLALNLKAQTHSFEPHPKIFERLRENVKSFPDAQTHSIALSDQAGSFDLYIPKDFQKNEGIASLEPIESAEKIQVTTKTLDSFELDQVKLLKIDVEGHEASVLKGASQMIENKKIKYIIFEDFDFENSEAIEFLKSKSYCILRLHKTLLGPKLLELKDSKDLPLWEPPNFIAGPKREDLQNIFNSSYWTFL